MDWKLNVFGKVSKSTKNEIIFKYDSSVRLHNVHIQEATNMTDTISDVETLARGSSISWLLLFLGFIFRLALCMMGQCQV